MPIITDKFFDDLKSQIEGMRRGRWEKVWLERHDEKRTIMCMVKVNDLQGDDDTNVESILADLSALFEKFAGREIPGDDFSIWAISISYLEGIDGNSGAAINSVTNNSLRRRLRHGSPEHIALEKQYPDPNNAKWMARRNLM